MASKDNHKKSFKPILAGTEEWPVVQLSKNREEFIEEVVNESVQRLLDELASPEKLMDELEATLYSERMRIKENPWKVDPDDEVAFWRDIKSRLVDAAIGPEMKRNEASQEILRDIVKSYTHQMAGNFKRSSYRLAREIVKFGFARLLNATRVKRFGAIFRSEYTLDDKIKILGQRRKLRRLAGKGTVVLVPTHFSNMDSILVGWIIHVLGLPAVIYGAGLNLFNISLFAYFMNSLGAYKVDRRRKNLTYLETLKAYSRIAIQRGAHSLFFPGGTRSRSGQIEKSLKLGLLGTTIEAQRHLFQQSEQGKATKIFIVPMVINYNFVLEAPGLINQYLTRKGQERYYVESDEYSTTYKILTFLVKFFTKGSDISVSIGKPMDVLGNFVDEEGNSYDRRGRVIDTRDYFVSQGRITIDRQREEQYTSMLGNAIVREYYRANRVFPSHLVAFVAFHLFKRQYPQFDLYNLLRLPEEDLLIPYLEFCDTAEVIREKVYQLKRKNSIHTASELKGDIEAVIKQGMTNIGMYHSKRPLLFNRQGDIVTQDLSVLYYYHNRLQGYEFHKFI